MSNMTLIFEDIWKRFYADETAVQALQAAKYYEGEDKEKKEHLWKAYYAEYWRIANEFYLECQKQGMTNTAKAIREYFAEDNITSIRSYLNRNNSSIGLSDLSENDLAKLIMKFHLEPDYSESLTAEETRTTKRLPLPDFALCNINHSDRDSSYRLARHCFQIYNGEFEREVVCLCDECYQDKLKNGELT